MLILGLGNEILRDDGVGLAAARQVARIAGTRAQLREACVATVDLLPILSGYTQVVVIDAWRSPQDPPGTAIHANPEDLPPGFGYRSAHTLPFREMLEFGQDLGLEMPQRISIHGLSVVDTDTFGTGFTPPVERRWRRWAEEIARIEGLFDRPVPPRPRDFLENRPYR